MNILSFILVVLLSQVLSNPIPKESKNSKDKVLYDQRQEGEWNIRADLNNLVILVVPKTSELQETAGPTLLDFLIRSHSKHQSKHVKNAAKSNDEAINFLESKTAPYHVDITKSSSHLMNDEILATQTPLLALKKNNEEKSDKETPSLRKLRSTKAFVLTVPEEDFVLTKMEDDKKVVKKDGIKKKLNNIKEGELMLIGATEQCGPDMFRDSKGVCQLKKSIDIKEDRDE
ncbi:unnamed protein product [Ceutorhynchus assimilis]|uniref:Uncharacterized protein n=1 Tax=Ceutorhynchus assimilis TaxID=467358 RepID=A0A9N9QJ18_9CUCU|nr:unnamed protein product [Ceutorhynchus assimilis]